MADLKAFSQRLMDPVSVALNLWASQRAHEESGGSGFAHWRDVFPGVPLDEDGAVVPDPPDHRPGPPPANAPQRTDAGREYEASPGKYSDRPRWDWTTLSACEVVEWALGRYTGDREAMRRLLLEVHPDAGRFCREDYPSDPFVAAARRSLDRGASARDARDWARVQRSSYGAFRRLVRAAVGSATEEDGVFAAEERRQYERAARHHGRLDAEKTLRDSEALGVESASGSMTA